MSEATQGRLDKWLWHARFFRTRERAAQACETGRVRLNRQVVLKPHHVVRPGDVLTFAQGDHIRVVRVLALAERRGDAQTARGLYTDLSPYDLSNPPSVATASEGAKP
jgi:ribosome-associated heat shock protein Hsp15